MQPYTPRCIQNFRKVKDHDIKFYCSNDIKSKIKILDHKHVEGTAKNSQDNKVLRREDQGIFNSGCSRHMTEIKSFFIDYQEIDGGFVAFGRSPKGGRIYGKVKVKTVLLKVLRQNNMYNFNLQNVVPSGGLTCLFAKATIDEPNLWHKRLGHINFKTMNKPVRGNLVREFVTKPNNKTPYELLLGRSPIIDFMKPFGCPVTILNTLDHLGKFEGKADEGFLVGYFINRQAGWKKASEHEYILLSFMPSSTQTLDDKDANELLNKGDEGVSKGSGINDQEKTDSNTQDVYKVEKALYGLHQAPKAWYETISTYLLENGFRRGTIDKTLFIKKNIDDILLVQVYVDDIIFGSTKKSLCDKFEQMMYKRFQMSYMGELNFFLGLQVKQKDNGIFISQDKYMADTLKKFDFINVKTVSTLMEPNKAFIKDAQAEDVDVNLYRSMIESLMYLTASRPDIMFAVYACARFQVTPNTSHLHAMKRIFRYLKGQPKLGLWYPKDPPFDLDAFFDSDYAGPSLNKKSITRASIRRDLKLQDTEGTTCLPNDAIFKELARMRKYKSRRKYRKEIKVPYTEPQAEERVPTPSNDPLPSAKIEKLQKKVKKLEGKKKKITHALKRLYKGRMNEEDLFRVHNLEGDEVIVDFTAGENVEQDATVAEKEVTTADDVKGKAKMVELERPLKRKEQIMMYEQIARDLEA
nr:uncharacterized mitochondrial protein AtMg00810-like [Tanacetum cinerariifolium]